MWEDKRKLKLGGRYTETFCTTFTIFLKTEIISKLKEYFKKKLVLEGTTSCMAEWGINRLTTLEIITINSEQNTGNYLKVLESEPKLADFDEELKLGRSHQH